MTKNKYYTASWFTIGQLFLIPRGFKLRAFIASWLALKEFGITWSKVSIRGIADYLRFPVSQEAIGSWDWLKLYQKGSFVDISDGHRKPCPPCT